MSIAWITSLLMGGPMQYETQMLIIQLRKEERRRENRLPTAYYRKEIEDALNDFIAFLNNHPETLTKSS